jgi:hypothetical protein
VTPIGHPVHRPRCPRSTALDRRPWPVSLRCVDPDQPHIDLFAGFEEDVEGVAIDGADDVGAGSFPGGSRRCRRRSRLLASATRGVRAGAGQCLAGDPVTVTVQGIGIPWEKLALGFGLIGEVRTVVVDGTSGASAGPKGHSREEPGQGSNDCRSSHGGRPGYPRIRRNAQDAPSFGFSLAVGSQLVIVTLSPDLATTTPSFVRPILGMSA